MRPRTPRTALALTALLAACGRTTSARDAGAEAPADVSLDAATDAPDAPLDAATDTPAPDATTDAPADVPVDVPADATTDGPCRPGLTSCGDYCVNLAIDTASCGACGRRCEGIEACAGGRCVGPGSACGEGGYPCCADAGAPCAAPLVCALGICTAAERVCGHRGEACCPGALVCEAGAVCSGGTCR